MFAVADNIGLCPGTSADAAEVGPDVVLDFDSTGAVIGGTIEHASERVDLGSLTVNQLPARNRAA